MGNLEGIYCKAEGGLPVSHACIHPVTYHQMLLLLL